MCGIAGIWTLKGNVDHHSHDLSNAVKSLNHRGPDDNGIWTNDYGVALGHARLSILDLSSHGHQPMCSADKRYAMVFNGEVYNFKEIRLQLITKGYSFIGSGDTEVILAAFQEWGDEAINRFIGMFAIALWDAQQQILTLIRDRVGVKPLYYGWDGNSLWFGSELKALREFKHWQAEIDMQAAGEFFQYGYISSSRSIYKNIHKLKPGHLLKLRLEGEPEVNSYWSVSNNLSPPMQGSDEDIEAELEGLLLSACNYRMVSDVPVGVYLSGGVDSSLVAAMLAGNKSQQINTFTIGFNENTHNESIWAKKVAAHLGTRHTEYILDVHEALAIARQWGNLFDEPFGDSSGIPTLLVSKLASQQVKVVLSADGGDELFSGYSVYSDVIGRNTSLSRIPHGFKTLSASALSAIPITQLDNILSKLPLSAQRRGFIIRKIKRLRAILENYSPGTLYDAAISYWLPEEVSRLLGMYQPPRESIDSYTGNIAEQMCRWDFHNYLPEDILTKVDRTTMSASIEGREPLLDHRLIEYAFRLPLHLRRGNLGHKHILKKILYKHVPQQLIDRPKQGFGIPLERWLSNELKPLVNDYLNINQIKQAGILNSRIIERITSDFYSGDKSLASQLWFLLAFEMWREKWA
jgi:asparagine synthase (glutamine-hydrolysing)